MPALLKLKSLLLAGFVLVGCSSPQPLWRYPAAVRLADLMVERLEWMDEVAAIKQERGLPVVDAKRERALLRAMEAKGIAAGLPRTAVQGFFAGQMEAAKERQRLSMLPASRGTPVRARPRLPDLNREVRPALDRIGEQMIEALARARREGIPVPAAHAAARRGMVRRGYPESVIEPSLQGLTGGLR